MRIALVNSIRFYGGGEKRVLRGAYEFGRRGHQVTVVVQPKAELGERCRAEGIPVEEVAQGRYYSPAVATGLGRALERLCPDVTVCYDERAIRIAALAARTMRLAPLVYYYGLEASFKRKPYNRLMVLPMLARVIANAQVLGEELLAFGWVPAEKVNVVYDGLDPTPVLLADPAGVREELGAVPADVVILTAARLAPEKGHAFMLDAIHDLAPRFPQLKVWIAGEGPEATTLETQIRSTGLEHRVRLLGFRRDVPRLLRAADILCHPSRREGAPNAVREGMAAGLPVAAVAASGTPELVSEGETGFLSAIDDSEGLKRNLGRLIEDPALRQRMGEAGRRRALAEFSEDVCAERWLEILSEVAHI